MESLEILLLLSAGTIREYTAEEVSRTLRTSLESAAARLKELHRAKLLVTVENEGSPKYRFDSASPGAVVVADLEKVYKTRRVSVISLTLIWLSSRAIPSVLLEFLIDWIPGLPQP